MYFTFFFTWGRAFDFSVLFVYTLLMIPSPPLPHSFSPSPSPPPYPSSRSSPPPPPSRSSPYSTSSPPSSSPPPPSFLLVLVLVLRLFFLLLIFFFYLCHYGPWWTLASSKIVLHCSLCRYLKTAVPYACNLKKFLNWLKAPQLRFPNTPNAFQFKSSKLSARVQFLHSIEVSQPLQSFCFYHFDYVQFIVERIKLILVSCDPFTSESNYWAPNKNKCNV